MLLPRHSRERSQGSQPVASTTCTNVVNARGGGLFKMISREGVKPVTLRGRKALTYLQTRERARMAAKWVMVLLPRQSRGGRQGCQPVASAACTNGVTASDDRSFKTISRECIKQVLGNGCVAFPMVVSTSTLVAALKGGSTRRVKRDVSWRIKREEDQGDDLQHQLRHGGAAPRFANPRTHQLK